ncbi:MAG TPA: LacI family DNA-binding transcriptional regulator [Candidatus Eisenbacteria bacterium]|nr:LacI family DNA-binding transcriptional regulator [Candidatus Eisenbacteria bacterium]
MLADYVGFAPATVSLVINQSEVAENIPQRTKDLIFAAAEKLHYRPNFVARSLRTQRTFSVGVIVPEISEGYETQVLSGIEDYLLNAGYFYFVASHRHKPDLIDEYPKLLLGRSVDGIIAVDTPWKTSLPVPVVTVSGHNEVSGVTNVEIDHDKAAELALRHLAQLGHRQLAFIKGQQFSSDTELRWTAIARAAQKLGLPIAAELVTQLVGDTASPELGYKVTRKLIATRKPFTALFAFNDISAIGAIHALDEAGLRVPQEVSVVGFDDIQSAAFQRPALTTVRQPLRKMGKIAAETLLRRINSKEPESKSTSVVVEPELVVRETTGPAPARESMGKLEASVPSKTAGAISSHLRVRPPANGAVQRLMQETGVSRETAEAVLDAVAGFLRHDPS